jgi:hypothetical protein
VNPEVNWNGLRGLTALRSLSLWWRRRTSWDPSCPPWLVRALGGRLWMRLWFENMVFSPKNGNFIGKMDEHGWRER